MKIEKIERIACRLPLKQPFVTSYGQLTEKAFDLYLVTTEDKTMGIGELVAFEQPDYIEETLFSARQVIETALIPLLIDQEIELHGKIGFGNSDLGSIWQANASKCERAVYRNPTECRCWR